MERKEDDKGYRSYIDRTEFLGSPPSIKGLLTPPSFNDYSGERTPRIYHDISSEDHNRERDEVMRDLMATNPTNRYNRSDLLSNSSSDWDSPLVFDVRHPDMLTCNSAMARETPPKAQSLRGPGILKGESERRILQNDLQVGGRFPDRGSPSVTFRNPASSVRFRMDSPSSSLRKDRDVRAHREDQDSRQTLSPKSTSPVESPSKKQEIHKLFNQIDEGLSAASKFRKGLCWKEHQNVKIKQLESQLDRYKSDMIDVDTQLKSIHRGDSIFRGILTLGMYVFSLVALVTCYFLLELEFS